MTEIVDLAIIGAGPAGMAAAVAAINLDVTPLVIDDGFRPGGQYFRQSTLANGRPRTTLPAKFAQSGVTLLPNTTVWAIFPAADHHLLCLYSDTEQQRRLRARRVILATGAVERPYPFPGWTLPGVITTGAALTLLKSQRILPGRRILVSGTGPLAWITAAKLLAAGGERVRLLDANPFPWRSWRYLSRLRGQSDRLAEGWQALRTLQQAGERIHWQQTVLAAEGKEAVNGAVVGRLDGTSRRRISVDTICLGHGLTPATPLARQAGCAHMYAPQWGGWAAVRDPWLQTTVSGIFIAGDGAGIHGKDAAIAAGRLAAAGAARSLGRMVSTADISDWKREWVREQAFAVMLQALFPFPTGTARLLQDETTLCRCEGIPAGEVRRRIAEGADSLPLLRRLSRAGLGVCQGRMCGSVVAEMLATTMGKERAALTPPTPRPPVLPVPLVGLIET